MYITSDLGILTVLNDLALLENTPCVIIEWNGEIDWDGTDTGSGSCSSRGFGIGAEGTDLY